MHICAPSSKKVARRGRICAARARARSWAGLRRRADAAAAAGAIESRHRSQRMCGVGAAECGLRGSGGENSARRLDSGSQPYGLSSPLGLDETTPSDRHLRISETVQAHRRIAARSTPAGACAAECQDDSGGRAASRVRAPLVDSARSIFSRMCGYWVSGPLRSSSVISRPATSCLNLRYPTVGENSGTLMRALGLGKAVIVSAVGSFSELPESICLKAPVDASEEDHLFEYLNLLVSRSDVRSLWAPERGNGWKRSAPGRRSRNSTRSSWSRSRTGMRSSHIPR